MNREMLLMKETSAEKPQLYVRWSEIIRHPIKFFKASQPFILSHHPDCEKYKHHYIVLGGYKLCIGCFFGIFPATITLVLLVTLNLIKLIYEHYLIATIIALLFSGATLHVLSKESKLRRILSKFSLAHGLILLLIYHHYYFLPKFISSPIIRIMLTLILYLILVQSYYAIRYISDYRTCSKCEQFKDYPFCDGFRELIIKLSEEGFIEVKSEGNKI